MWWWHEYEYHIFSHYHQLYWHKPNEWKQMWNLSFKSPVAALCDIWWWSADICSQSQKSWQEKTGHWFHVLDMALFLEASKPQVLHLPSPTPLPAASYSSFPFSKQQFSLHLPTLFLPLNFNQEVCKSWILKISLFLVFALF